MIKQLLIVDDDISLSNSISEYLINAGFCVALANSANAAMQQIKFTKPDMIITDIMMPYIDGYELIKRLRLDTLLFNIPVIFLTAKGMTADRIKGYNVGCNAYLTKPFDPEELLSIINNLFNNIHLLQQTISNENSHLLIHDKPSFIKHLTYRELTILKLVIKGYRNKEIAQCLKVSTRNVEKYVSQLLNKTSTRNRTELAQLVANETLHLPEQRANDGNRTRE